MLNSRPRLLHLCHRFPFPPDKGDRIRSFHSLRYLAERCTVDVACLADEPVPPGMAEELARHCDRLSIAPIGRAARLTRGFTSLLGGGSITEGAFWSPQLARTAAEWAATTQYDACLASSSGMIPYLRLPGLRRTAALVDLVDVDSQKWLDYAAASRWPRSWLYRTEGQRLRRLEQALPGWTSGVLLTTAAEVEIFERFAGPGTATVVNNGVDLDYFAPAQQSPEPLCAFVGAFDYKPNVDGALWFCEKVWPQVRRRRADAQLYLVGRRPTPAVVRLAELPGVTVTGTVADVRPYVARAAVVLAPLRIARGVQNKVLEALAMARAVIASPTCLGGLEARPDVELLAAESASEWVAAVDRILGDAPLRRRLGEAGRAYVERRHSWERCLEPLGERIARTVTQPDACAV